MKIIKRTIIQKTYNKPIRTISTIKQVNKMIEDAVIRGDPRVVFWWYDDYDFKTEKFFSISDELKKAGYKVYAPETLYQNRVIKNGRLLKTIGHSVVRVEVSGWSKT